MKTYIINDEGHRQIREKLIALLKPELTGWFSNDLRDSKEAQEMLRIWSDDIQDGLNSLEEGECWDGVELSQHSTKSGHTERLTIDENGYWECETGDQS